MDQNLGAAIVDQNSGAGSGRFFRLPYEPSLELMLVKTDQTECDNALRPGLNPTLIVYQKECGIRRWSL